LSETPVTACRDVRRFGCGWLLFFGEKRLKTGPIEITRISRSEMWAIAAAEEKAKSERLRPSQLGLAKLTKYRTESITVEPGAPVPDCQECGVCCDFDSFIPVGFAGSERMAAYVEMVDDSEPTMAVDRFLPHDFTAGRCAHLEGKLGERVGCRAYDVRPDLCRAFEAGSDLCMELRRMYGLEPQLDPASLARFSPAVEARTVGVITGAACVVDSVSCSIAASAEDPGTFETIRRVQAKVLVAVDADAENVIELHSYEAGEEVWLQGEFLGLTVAEAREFIKGRLEQGVSN